MKKFKKLLVCMLAVMMLISSAIPVSAASRPAIPTLRSAQMTSSGRMSLSWKSVSNANGYKVRIYNCRKKKASSIHLSGRYNNNYYTNTGSMTGPGSSNTNYNYSSGSSGTTAPGSSGSSSSSSNLTEYQTGGPK